MAEGIPTTPPAPTATATPTGTQGTQAAPAALPSSPAASATPAAPGAPPGTQEAPVAPPVATPDGDAFARKFEGAARLEAKGREALRTAEQNRQAWEAAAEKRAEERLIADLRKDSFAALRARGVSDKEAALIAQRQYATAAGIPKEELPPEVRALIEKNEMEVRLEKLERGFENAGKSYTEAQARAADIRTAHEILGKASDDAPYARSEFKADPFAASQEFTRIYDQMNAAGAFVGARNSNEIARAVTVQYNRTVKERVQATLAKHGHAETQTTKAQLTPAPVPAKGDVASVSGPATRPDTRPTTDKEWREYFDKSRKQTRP